MNFPLENPFFRFVYWLMDTPGVGGLVVGLMLALALAIYAATLTWIARGGQDGDPETYSYPTPALHHHS